MVGVHQILTAASAGDAITDAALEIRNILRGACESEVYGRHIAPDIADEVRRLADYAPRHPGDVLIYHASIGEPLVHAFLLSRREPLILIYHNVTPAKYFERWDPKFAELLDLGRSELLELRHRVAAAVAVSKFNAAELEAMGYRNVRVIPPIIDTHRLTRVEPTESTLHHLDSEIREPYFLYVGQLLPHKRPDLLVQAMHIGATYLGLDALMMLVGHPRLPAYRAALEELIRELNLANVHLVGPVSKGDLAAFYSRASGIVTASEHEGFCVPLIEAMSFGKPIVARAAGAVPETLGAGGMLLGFDDGPAVYAEALTELMSSPPLRDDLSARATRRGAQLDSETPTAELLSLLCEVL
jgi:glycosyltransferase involved in cell wall biosynthesis